MVATVNICPCGQLDKLAVLRQRFATLNFVIIDEISMVSCQTFCIIHKRLSEIKGTLADPTTLFGGLNILVFGDLFQLRPVMGHFVFDSSRPESYLWRNFDVSILTYNHRQADDRNWASVLNRIRLGCHSESDCAELLQRQKVDLTKPPFCNALRIFPLKADVEKHNLTCLQSQIRYSKLYEIIAKDVVVQAPDRLTPDEISRLKPYKVNDTAGLTDKLQLTVGSRVMLIRNIAVDEGLVNGAQGFVTGVEFEADHNFPSAIYVAFDNNKIGASFQRLGMAVNIDGKIYNHNVKLSAIDVQFYGKFDIHWQRTQFPLTLSWATTVHKVQGITLDYAVLDIGATVFQSGMTYVTLSRVRSIHGLALINFEKRKILTSSKSQNEMVVKLKKIALTKINHSQNFNVYVRNVMFQRLKQRLKLKPKRQLTLLRFKNTAPLWKHLLWFLLQTKIGKSQRSLLTETAFLDLFLRLFIIISVITRQFDTI